MLRVTITHQVLGNVTSNNLNVLQHATQSVSDMVFPAHVQNQIAGVLSIERLSKYFDSFERDEMGVENIIYKHVLNVPFEIEVKLLLLCVDITISSDSGVTSVN